MYALQSDTHSVFVSFLLCNSYSSWFEETKKFLSFSFSTKRREGFFCNRFLFFLSYVIFFMLYLYVHFSLVFISSDGLLNRSLMSQPTKIKINWWYVRKKKKIFSSSMVLSLSQWTCVYIHIHIRRKKLIKINSFFFTS